MSRGWRRAAWVGCALHVGLRQRVSRMRWRQLGRTTLAAGSWQLVSFGLPCATDDRVGAGVGQAQRWMWTVYSYRSQLTALASRVGKDAWGRGVGLRPLPEDGEVWLASTLPLRRPRGAGPSALGSNALVMCLPVPHEALAAVACRYAPQQQQRAATVTWLPPPCCTRRTRPGQCVGRVHCPLASMRSPCSRPSVAPSTLCRHSKAAPCLPACHRRQLHSPCNPPVTRKMSGTAVVFRKQRSLHKLSLILHRDRPAHAPWGSRKQHASRRQSFSSKSRCGHRLCCNRHLDPATLRIGKHRG